MTWDKKKTKPEEIVKLDQKVEISILELDINKRKVSLSIKLLEELKNTIDVPIIDDLIARKKERQPKNVDNITYLFGDDNEKGT